MSGLYQLTRTDDDGTEISLAFPSDVTADEFLEHVRDFMLANGYHPSTVAEVLPDIEIDAEEPQT